MKVSLICTTLNEGSSIACLIDSMLSQTKLPDEVVFVDAGSTDETLDIIGQAKRNTKLNIRLIKKKTNRSQGRNLAVKKAKYDVIAATDAGCVLDKYWLERITAPLIEDRADSVAGFYLTVAPTLMSKSLAPFVAVMPSHFDKHTFLPSSRSVAFTREAWQKVKGYPEELDFCEDLVFAQRLEENTRMLRVKAAIVCWRVDTDLAGFFGQIRNYARGDVEAGYMPHLVKNSTIFMRYFVFLVVPPVFLLYLAWPIVKHYEQVNHVSGVFYLPILQVVADMAVMVGSVQGLIANQAKPSLTFQSRVAVG